MLLLHIQDIFFTIIHFTIIIVNLFGWILPISRKFNLVLLTLTLLSWIGLGYFYGIGYCPITDWHWRVKENMGETNLPNSYIKYFLDKFFQIDSNPFYVDVLTGGSFFAAFILSIYANFFKKRLK